MTNDNRPTRPAVERRKEPFAKKITTKLWQEIPSESNPYIAEQARCHGYDIVELMEKRSYLDVLFLLFRGEFPSQDESKILQALMVACINPGPRHPATRAAMNAGIGKTDPSHILPISLSILGGDHLGGAEVEAAMRWLRKQNRKKPSEVAESLLHEIKTEKEDKISFGDIHIAPGFGSRFNSIEILPQEYARQLTDLPGAGKVLKWGQEFTACLQDKNSGWLITGLVAATLCDLGFQPRSGPGLFQLFCAPGLLAHGVEMLGKPINEMPFLEDEHYFFEENKPHE